MYITTKTLPMKGSRDHNDKIRPVSIPIYIERHWEPVRVNIPPPPSLDNSVEPCGWYDRKKRIDDALSWLRTELSNLKIQDQQILGQFRKCQDTIENLKSQKNSWHDSWSLSEDDLEEDHWEDWEIAEFERDFDKSIKECRDLEKQCLDLETDFEKRRHSSSFSSSTHSDKRSPFYHKYSESESSSGSSSYFRQDVENLEKRLDNLNVKRTNKKSPSPIRAREIHKSPSPARHRKTKSEIVFPVNQNKGKEPITMTTRRQTSLIDVKGQNTTANENPVNLRIKDQGISTISKTDNTSLADKSQAKSEISLTIGPENNTNQKTEPQLNTRSITSLSTLVGRETPPVSNHVTRGGIWTSNSHQTTTVTPTITTSRQEPEVKSEPRENILSRITIPAESTSSLRSTETCTSSLDLNSPKTVRDTNRPSGIARSRIWTPPDKSKVLVPSLDNRASVPNSRVWPSSRNVTSLSIRMRDTQEIISPPYQSTVRANLRQPEPRGSAWPPPTRRWTGGGRTNPTDVGLRQVIGGVRDIKDDISCSSQDTLNDVKSIYSTEDNMSRRGTLSEISSPVFSPTPSAFSSPPFSPNPSMVSSHPFSPPPTAYYVTSPPSSNISSPPYSPTPTVYSPPFSPSPFVFRPRVARTSHYSASPLLPSPLSQSTPLYPTAVPKPYIPPVYTDL